MELVYLWVEDYKNIHQQGFNFSGRYRCNYDADLNELTIYESKDYIHVFPENINVTAIIGENGSGKSSILNCVREILYSKKIHNRQAGFKFIGLFSLENELKICTNVQLQHQIPNFENLSDIDFYLYLASDQKKTMFLNISDEDVSTKKEHYNIFELNNYAIGEMITSKYISPIDFHLTTFMYLPNKIDVKVKLSRLYSHKIDQYEYSTSFGSFYDMSNDNEDKAYKDARNQSWAKKDDLEQLFENAESEYDRFLMFLYIQNFGDDNYYEFDNRKFLLEELDGHWYKLTEREFNKYFKDGIKNINHFTQKEKDIFFNHYKEFFHFDFIDSENRRFENLSHGEQTIFGQMLNIYYYSLQNKNNLFFLFDEPDLALHPEWQRRYFKEVWNLLIQMDQKFHLIITSHSPFILSDLPKDNVIFLEDGKQVYPNIDTFGANIHTLLSHGFFMTDGLMGEFAKEKINQIINYLNDKESEIIDNETAQKFINIIGEPILKRQLQKMLDSKRISRMDEIDELKKRIELLESKQ